MAANARLVAGLLEHVNWSTGSVAELVAGGGTSSCTGARSAMPVTQLCIPVPQAEAQ